MKLVTQIFSIHEIAAEVGPKTEIIKTVNDYASKLTKSKMSQMYIN